MIPACWHVARKSVWPSPRAVGRLVRVPVTDPMVSCHPHVLPDTCNLRSVVRTWNFLESYSFSFRARVVTIFYDAFVRASCIRCNSFGGKNYCYFLLVKFCECNFLNYEFDILIRWKFFYRLEIFEVVLLNRNFLVVVLFNEL